MKVTVQGILEVLRLFRSVGNKCILNTRKDFLGVQVMIRIQDQVIHGAFMINLVCLNPISSKMKHI